jgi:hypothetical protein
MAEDNSRNIQDGAGPVQTPKTRLTEPAPILVGNSPERPDGLRVSVHDGLDNSDLRMLLDLAAKKANKDE